MKISLVKLSRLVKSVTNRVSKSDKAGIFVVLLRLQRTGRGGQAV